MIPMAKCDICGASASLEEMRELRDSYQVPGVVDLCPKCIDWANKELTEIRLATAPEMRRRIALRAGKPWPLSRWQRIKRWFSSPSDPPA